MLVIEDPPEKSPALRVEAGKLLFTGFHREYKITAGVNTPVGADRMQRQICAAALALALAVAPFVVRDAHADAQTIVRIEHNDISVTGVALANGVFVAPGSGFSNAAQVTVFRDSASTDATVTIAGGLAIVRANGGSGATAQLAADDGEPAASVDVFAAQGSSVQHASAALEAGEGTNLRLAGTTQGGVVFNGCGEVVALAPPGGALISASSIASALQIASVPVSRAEAACGATANANVRALESQVGDLRRQLAAANNAARRRELEADISALEERIQTELAAEAEQRTAIEVSAREAEKERASERQLAFRIAIGVGALLVVLLGVAAWLFFRSRKLDKSLAAARKEDEGWNDCVLESASGLTVKLSGKKLMKGGVVVGRSRQDADVVVDKDDVSRRHARFEVLDGALHVSDLGSTNKTQVNGRELERAIVKRLEEGDEVSIGSNKFTVRILRRGGA